MGHALSWTATDIPAQHGRRFLITGANSGIGFPAAVELARHGGVVLLAARDRARGEAALARLRQQAVGPGSALSRRNSSCSTSPRSAPLSSVRNESWPAACRSMA